MIDIQKQIAYWSNGAAEDMEAAHDLISKDARTLHGLFFAHGHPQIERKLVTSKL